MSKSFICRPDKRTINIMTREDELCRVEISAKDGFVFELVRPAYDHEHNCVTVRLKVKRPAAKKVA